jgi:hypothetical protein
MKHKTRSSSTLTLHYTTIPRHKLMEMNTIQTHRYNYTYVEFDETHSTVLCVHHPLLTTAITRTTHVARETFTEQTPTLAKVTLDNKLWKQQKNVSNGCAMILHNSPAFVLTYDKFNTIPQ